MTNEIDHIDHYEIVSAAGTLAATKPGLDELRQRIDAWKLLKDGLFRVGRIELKGERRCRAV